MKNCDRGVEIAAKAAGKGQHFKCVVIAFHYTSQP